MGILEIILIICIIIFAFWAINKWVTPGIFRNVLLCGLGIIVFLWVLSLLGFLGSAESIRIGN